MAKRNGSFTMADVIEIKTGHFPDVDRPHEVWIRISDSTADRETPDVAVIVLTQEEFAAMVMEAFEAPEITEGGYPNG